jgi:inner membrane protein
MEPVTHLMTGACLARAGCNRKAAYATLAMTLAAEAPDLDTLWGAGGPVAAFEHHRGITHTLMGLPFDAALVVGAVWLLHRWRLRRDGIAATKAPVRWGLLYGFCLIALLSHLLLDWTNNYGLRPFFPFNPHWYAGSFVFIFEPVLFGVLLLAMVAPFFFGLIGSEVGAKRPAFRGQNWAIFALLATVALWTWRWVEHADAVMLAEREYFGGAPKLRVFASPYPTNPYKWHAVVETPDHFQMATVDTNSGEVRTAGAADVVYKPPTTLATLAAKRSWLGHVYLDWSMYPVVEQTGMDANGVATVSFRDLRFDYDTFLVRADANDKPADQLPLSGTVLVDQDRRVVEMRMDGHVQR